MSASEELRSGADGSLRAPAREPTAAMGGAEVSFWAGGATWIAARFAGFGSSRAAALAALLGALGALAAWAFARGGGRSGPELAPSTRSLATIRVLLFAWALHRGVGALLGDGPAVESWAWLVALGVFASASLAGVRVGGPRPMARAAGALALGALALWLSTRAAAFGRAALGALGSALLLAALTCGLDVPAGETERGGGLAPVIPWLVALGCATVLLWVDRPFAAGLVAAVALGRLAAPGLGFVTTAPRGTALWAGFVLALHLAGPYGITRAACRLTKGAVPDFSAAIWCR